MNLQKDLCNIALTEKEDGKYRAAKGILLLLVGILLLMVAWLVFPKSTAPITLLYIISIVLFIGCAASIWYLVDALKDVYTANKYLHKHRDNIN